MLESQLPAGHGTLVNPRLDMDGLGLEAQTGKHIEWRTH